MSRPARALSMKGGALGGVVTPGDGVGLEIRNDSRYEWSSIVAVPDVRVPFQPFPRPGRHVERAPKP